MARTLIMYSTVGTRPVILNSVWSENKHRNDFLKKKKSASCLDNCYLAWSLVFCGVSSETHQVPRLWRKWVPLRFWGSQWPCSLWLGLWPDSSAPTWPGPGYQSHLVLREMGCLGEKSHFWISIHLWLYRNTSVSGSIYIQQSVFIKILLLDEYYLDQYCHEFFIILYLLCSWISIS